MSMQSAFSRRLDDEEPLDQDSLLQTITSLREDLSSMKASMRRMLRENLELRQELGAARPREASVDELNRVRDEVDLFSRLYDEPALPRRARPTRPRADGGRRDLLRSMMMMMMMSELL